MQVQSVGQLGQLGLNFIVVFKDCTGFAERCTCVITPLENGIGADEAQPAGAVGAVIVVVVAVLDVRVIRSERPDTARRKNPRSASMSASSWSSFRYRGTNVDVGVDDDADG